MNRVGGQLGVIRDTRSLLLCVQPNLVLMSCEVYCKPKTVKISSCGSTRSGHKFLRAELKPETKSQN